MADGLPSCKELGIPERLHTQGRPILDSCPSHVHLYRRYPQDIGVPAEGPVSAPPSVLGDVFRDCHETSVTRGDLGEPEDVLWDGVNGSHFLDWGILEATTEDVHERVFTITVNDARGVAQERPFVFRVVHDPERCIYPHCLIETYRGNGEKVPTVPKNPKEKLGLRTELGRLFRKYRDPR